MGMNVRGRSFLKLLDYTPQEIRYLLDLSREFKAKKRSGTPHCCLPGKNIVLIFEKTSTRTRCAFEVAARDLGMGVTYLDPGSSQMGKKESIPDTARVLGRMYDGIEYRGFDQKLVEQLAEYSGVPVYNGLTDQFHPTQMLADLLTIEEKFGRLKGLNFTYMGDARNNMGNSLMVACAKMGLNFTACAPKELFPAEDLVREAERIAAESGSTVRLTEDLYGHLGVHGRAGRGLGYPHPPAAPLPGEPQPDGEGRPRRAVYALPALLPRHENRDRGPDCGEIRPDGDGSDRRGVRIQPVGGVRRGGEPDAYHQSGAVRHAVLRTGPVFRRHYET